MCRLNTGDISEVDGRVDEVDVLVNFLNGRIDTLENTGMHNCWLN